MMDLIVHGDNLEWLKGASHKVHLTFFDPPFNQGHAYRGFNDNQKHDEYWDWIKKVLKAIYSQTEKGGAIYFMQREKNCEFVLSSLRESGWCFQNLIIWKKMTSPVPCSNRYNKGYQIIATATKDSKPRTFNKLRIDPPLLPHQKVERKRGVYLPDVWDDIRELTAGYFSGAEPIRTCSGNRFHKEQSPIALLLRIILSSSNFGDVVFDPFAGTGTTLVVAKQLRRSCIGVEIDETNVKCINERLTTRREIDNIERFRPLYAHTEDLCRIWGETASERGELELQDAYEIGYGRISVSSI